MRKFLISVALVVALPSSIAMAEEDGLSERNAEKAIAVRQSVFKLAGWNMGSLAAMARGRTPYDAAFIEGRAERMASLATMIPDAFAPDTRAFDMETEAKEKIWEDLEAFNARADDMVAAAEALKTLAGGSDVDAAKAAIGDLAATCKACHKTFRVK